jgi:hypothetical protein
MTVKNFLLGKNAKLYIDPDFDSDSGDTPDDETTLSDEMDNVTSAKLALGSKETDVTTRANGGWEATVKTLKNATLTFDMMWKPGDTAFDAIQAAYLADKEVAVGSFDQAKTVTGAQGIVGTWAVTAFDKDDPLDGPQKASVTLKLCNFGAWWGKTA